MEFKEFKIEDLFTVSRGTRHKKSNRKPGSVALVTAGEQNQGVAEYIDKGTKMTMYKNKITIDMFCNCFYRNYDFFCDDNILVLTSKTEIGKNSSLYIATLINKWKVNYNYGKQFRQKSLGEITISLPVTPSGEIDFDYMEQYVEKIERQYIEKIEKQYIEKIALMLKASGLDNYQLTEEEKAVLKEEKEKKEFKIEELFETIPTNRLHYKAGDYKVKTETTDLPATTCGNSNQMLTCYVPREGATILKNCISVTANGDATCFYQPNEFTILQDSYAIKSKNECSENIYLYFVAVLQKVLKVKYSWTNKSGWNKLKNDTIWLPINLDGDIDFDYMEKYISAIIKTKIKNVVLEINKKLELYKQTQN